MPVTKRSIVSVIVLSIITCSIYLYYWIYVTTRELQYATGRAQFSPALILVLTIFVPVAGYVLFAMEANARLNDVRMARGMPYVDNQVLWLILGIIFPIIEVALVQNEINIVT